MLDEVELMKYHNDFVDITDENLNLSVLIDKVRTEDSGAICTFSGTTRNYFVVDGIKRKVVSLEYESYTPMAIKEMQKTVKLARTKFQDINKIAVQHKIGKCLVGEESVCIAVSSSHRKVSFLACEFIIDELKRTCPIWKKEIYEDGSFNWKENSECCHLVNK